MLFGISFSSLLVLGLGLGPGSAATIPGLKPLLAERGQHNGNGWHKGIGWGNNPNRNYHGGKDGGWHNTKCHNSPTSRACWIQDYTVATDSEMHWPKTGKTVRYKLEITNITLSPDGTPRQMLVVNGQYPGPVITADWGDMLHIEVTNHMQDNGTSIHWHGFTQVGTNTEDGVSGVTECPIAPGSTRTYRFRATQFGTTWYHSHFSNQYGDGIVGPMVINGPSSADYDVDLGPVALTDFYYGQMTALAKVSRGETVIPGQVGPPTPENGLINGVNMNATKTGGHYFNTTNLVPGKKYKLRLLNTAIDNAFMVSLDSHQFTVIQADFIPIVPYTTDWIFVGIGQRYDVIFTAGAKPDNYWLRAEVQNGCGTNANNGQILGIFNYQKVPLKMPTTVSNATYTPGCDDESQLEPVLKKSVPRSEFEKVYGFNGTSTLTVGLTQNEKQIFFWTINGNAINVKWEQPTLRYVADGNDTFTAQKALGIIEIPQADIYTFWVIQNSGFAPHPIHLHGHDMYVLGVSSAADLPAPVNGTQSPAYFNVSNIDALNFESPTRRDVVMLPAYGWLVVAFETDNPGAWLMHCHIAWHVSEGLAVQFLEREDDIPGAMMNGLDKIDENCKAWESWYNSRPPTKDDSGL